MFHSSPSRNGAVYSNTTESIDCDAEPLQPWRHGYDVMKALREVSRKVIDRRRSSGLSANLGPIFSTIIIIVIIIIIMVYFRQKPIEHKKQ